MSIHKVAQASRSLPAYANTVGRAVHIQIHPQPRNLAESTEVMRVLQRYGELVMYKHLKHEPNLHAANNSALAIYQSPDSAQDVINASPLLFELTRPGAGSNSSDYHGSSQAPAVEKGEDRWVNRKQPEPEDLLAAGKNTMREAFAGETSPPNSNARDEGRNTSWAHTNLPTTPPGRTPKPFTPNPTPSSTSATSLPFPPSPSDSPARISETISREFHLTVSRSVLNHQAYIERQHYYGGFRLDVNTIMAEDLELRVPVKGLVDCQIDKGETPLRMRQKREIARGKQRKTLEEVWREAQL